VFWGTAFNLGQVRLPSAFETALLEVLHRSLGKPCFFSSWLLFGGGGTGKRKYDTQKLAGSEKTFGATEKWI
jgi:hypothetical protein